jgi:hypothetical protein
MTIIPHQNPLLALLSDPLEQQDRHCSYSIEYPLILLLSNHPKISKALASQIPCSSALVLFFVASSTTTQLSVNQM